MASDLNDDQDGAMASSLLALARILFSGQSVELTLEAVAQLAQETLGGCDSASVTVVEGGRPTTTVSTSELAWQIDQHQYASRQGPCLDAVRLRRVVRVDSYCDERRWPVLTAAALDHGARSSLSLPLVVLDEAVGALNLYSRTEAGFESSESVGQVFATQAAVTMANATALHRATDLAANLSVALEHRDVIGQAKGILMAQSDLSAEEAFDVLRRASQRSNRKLHELAGDVVSGPLDARFGGVMGSLPGEVDRGRELEPFRRDLMLARVELWVHYVGLGGAAAMAEVSGYLAGDGPIDRLEHNTIVQALNERFMDLGLNHPVSYIE